MHTVLQPEGWAKQVGYANGIAARGRFVFVGGQVGWTMKTSRPRIFSLIFTNVSPSGNDVTVASPSCTPM